MTQGNFDSAIKDARDRIKKNPDAHESHGLLGELLYQAGRYSEAIEPLQSAADILQSEFDKDPERIGMYSIELATKMLHSLYMMSGDSLLRLNRFEDAKSVIDKALKVINDDPDSWHYMGVAQANSEEIEDAMKSFREAVRLDPGRSDIWESLQKCYKHLNRLEVEKIDHALSNGNLSQNLPLLAELHLLAGEYEKTNLIIDQILKENKDDVQGLLLLTRLRLAEGSIVDSLELLQKILQKDTKNEEALWHLSRVHCLLGKGEESKKSLQALLKINPNHLNAQALTALLEKNEPAATQTIGVLTIEEYEIGYEREKETTSEQMVAYKIFPILNHPLGSTVEDIIHALVRCQLERFTDERFLKLVTVHIGFDARQPTTTTNASPSRGREFRYFEPGALTTTFMEQGYTRGVNPASDKSDLIESGDVILLTPKMSMTQGLRFASMYPVIKDRAEKELANWPYRF